MPDDARTIRRIRIVTVLFMLGLVLSGITAIPIETQLDALAIATGLEDASPQDHPRDSWRGWLLAVHHGVREMNAKHPFMGYAGDWLAFGHFGIALVFVWALREPARYRFLFDFGLLVCLLVIPYALIAGHFRGIPWWWRAADCSFGILGAIPMAVCRRWAGRLTFA